MKDAEPTLSRGVREMSGVRVAAVDFETFYDTKAKYSLQCMDPYAYVHDRRFDAYLVSVVADTGEFFVGRPVDFHWGCLDGALLVAHNAAFDGLVLNRLIETGAVPGFRRDWADTADLAAYLGAPRSLKDACRHLLGIEMSKAVRAGMDGRTLAQALLAGEGPALFDYAADDARHCLSLWQTYGGRWPEVEREISRLNRESGWEGVCVDRGAVEEGLAALRRVRSDAERLLPWTDCPDSRDNRAAGSLPALAAHARSLGLPVPPSFKKDCPEMQAWVAKYAPAHPFIRARLDLASATPHIARLESMLSLLGPDSRLRFSLFYHGAHTGRTSAGRDGDGAASVKFNPLNIPSDPRKTFGVDMRAMLRPWPGHKFVIFDYSQVEPRITHWIAGNTAFLAMAEKEDIYQAAAKVMGWYPMDRFDFKADDPAGRKLAKACTIGLGYSMGAAKFMLTCEKDGVDLGATDWTPETLDRRMRFIARAVAGIDWRDPANYGAVARLLAADAVVRKWRAANAAVTGLWAALELELRTAALAKVPSHTFALPGGRPKVYFEPRVVVRPKVVVDPDTGEESTGVESALMASVRMGAPAKPLHGGVLTENIVQAVARDVLYHGAVAVVRESGGRWRFSWNAYDEAIFMVPDADVGDALAVVPALMCGGPHLAWASGLPLAVEGGVFDRYTK